ncbi:MAG TPA: colicin immunity domain-containing protein [Chondromyces sp.]|nr:colicin immunity domain-containing protein [Chondromyces sp.]
MKYKVLDKYIKLIEAFLKNEIDVEEFEKIYFETFLNDLDEKELDEESFTILNNLFESVDCYWHECKPREER